MVLVTTLEFDPFYCRQILSKLNEYISNLELPEMTGEQSQFKFIEPFLLDAIEGSIPLSIEETILPILENRLQDLKSQGYLILNSELQTNQKLIQTNLEFELDTFLNSIFWEKLIEIDKECAVLLEKLFHFDPLQWFSIQTPLNLLMGIITKEGNISESFDSSLKYDLVQGYVQQLLDKIEPPSTKDNQKPILSACVDNPDNIPSAFDDLVGFCGIISFYVFDNSTKSKLSNHLSPEIEEQTVIDFLSTYLKKQQMGMDLVPELVIFHSRSQKVLISPHNNLYLIAFTGKAIDVALIADKIKEIWVRLDVGL